MSVIRGRKTDRLYKKILRQFKTVSELYKLADKAITEVNRRQDRCKHKNKRKRYSSNDNHSYAECLDCESFLRWCVDGAVDYLK